MFLKHIFLTISFFAILLVNVTQILAKEEKTSNVSMVKSVNDKYLIKFLSSYTEYPVKLIDYHKKPDTKW